MILAIADKKEEKLMNRISRVCEELVATKARVAVYGAGRHTAFLLKETMLAKADIIALIDDNAAMHNQVLWGLPVRGISDLHDMNPDTILLSVPQHQKKMYDSLAWCERSGIARICLYSSGEERELAHRLSARSLALLAGNIQNSELNASVMRTVDTTDAEIKLMFQYATCDDLIRLKAKYPEYCDLPPATWDANGWGLKMMGKLFCADALKRIRPKRILEIGAGKSVFFADKFASETEYWIVDQQPGYISPSEVENARKQRSNTREITGLIGDGITELPDCYFDVVFSISVLEHIPLDKKRAAYAEMHRVLKPGGYMVHTLDEIRIKSAMDYALMHECFILPENPVLKINTCPGDGPATLFEPLALYYCGYYGLDRSDMWTKQWPVVDHRPSVLICGKARFQD